MNTQETSKPAMESIEVNSIALSIGKNDEGDAFVQASVKLFGQGTFDYLGMVEDYISSISLKDFLKQYKGELWETVAPSPEKLLSFITKNRFGVHSPTLVNAQLTTRFRTTLSNFPDPTPTVKHLSETLRWDDTNQFLKDLQSNYRTVVCAMYDQRGAKRLVISVNTEKGHAFIHVTDAETSDTVSSTKIFDRFVVTEVAFKIYGSPLENKTEGF